MHFSLNPAVPARSPSVQGTRVVWSGIYHLYYLDQQQQVTPTEAATVHKGAENVCSPLRHAPGGSTERLPVCQTKTGPNVDVSQQPWKDIFCLG
eukprot:3355471-Rhodomonas_salina.1